MRGLVLQGGGAKGAFQIGALRALTEQKVSFDGVCGTSIGAINGALIAQGEADRLWELWWDLQLSDLFDTEDELLKLAISNELSGAKYLKEFLRLFVGVRTGAVRKGIDVSKAKLFLSGLINETKIRNSTMDYGLVTVSATKLQPLRLFKEDIPKGKLFDFVCASASFPLFEKMEIDEEHFVDGGFYDNLPVGLMVEKGYGDIVAIRLGNSIAPRKKVDEGNLHVTYIDPSRSLGNVLDFRNENVRPLLWQGYYDCARVIRGLAGTRYCVLPENVGYVPKLFYSMPYASATELAVTLRIEGKVPREELARRSIQYIKDVFYPKETAPSDFFMLVTALERTATELELDPLKFYTFPQFVTELRALLEEKSPERKLFFRSRQEFCYVLLNALSAIF